MSSSNHKIRSILFDLDGTLRHHTPEGSQVFFERLKELGFGPSDESKTRAMRWDHFYFANSLEIQQDGKTYKDDRKGFWVNFSRRRLVALGFSPAQALELAPRMSAHMAEAYKPQVSVPQDAFPLLESLKGSGYVLGVVSNREEPYQDELIGLGLDPYFQFALAGGEIDSYKPDARIFERALELSGTSAAETMYIGDNYFADAVGAHRAGLRPVLFDPGNLFPDAEFPVIRALSELRDLL